MLKGFRGSLRISGIITILAFSFSAAWGQPTPPTLFVSNEYYGTVIKINQATREQTVIARLDSSSVEGLTFEPDGRLYLALTGISGPPRRIVSFKPDGSDLTTVLDFATTPQLASSGGPEGPIFGPDG